MTIRAEIAAELCKAFERLGAHSDLLLIVGSYGDTLDDEEVLEQLRWWNEEEDLRSPSVEEHGGGS